MSDEDFKQRRRRQFDIWKDQWVSGTRSADDDPIFVYGHMIKYLIEPDHTPFLDLLGGGGFVPHGHGNRVIGESMGRMVNQVYQTSDRGEHVYAATAELMTKVEEHLHIRGGVWNFASSENEAFLILMEALRHKYRQVVVVNGSSSWPTSKESGHWSVTSSMSGPWGGLDFQDTAFVVYPVNPDTFEVLSPNSLTLLEELSKDESNIVVWDTTVPFGWTREVFDVPPWADAVLLGGALGGGLPFGAVLSQEQLPFPDQGRWSATAGNALTAQLGLHALLLCEGDEARDRYDLLVAAVGRELENIQTMLPNVVREIVGGGLLGGFRLSSADEAHNVAEGLKSRGVLVGSLGTPRNIVTFRVSRSTDPHDVSELFDKVFEILTEGQT